MRLTFFSVTLVALLITLSTLSCELEKQWQESFIRESVVEGYFHATISTGISSGNSSAMIDRYTGSSIDIEIPSHIHGVPVIRIASFAFYGMGLTSVIIPDGVLYIESMAFTFNKLSRVDIPESVEFIAQRAFSGNRLDYISLPTTSLFWEITDELFSNNKLTELTIPNNISLIGRYAFSRNLLTEVYIPDNVRTIDQGAFFGNNITKITIGENVYLWDSTRRNAFEFGFDDFYRENGRMAGTYTFDDTQWHAELSPKSTLPICVIRSSYCLYISRNFL
jgi:hypothetical protein